MIQSTKYARTFYLGLVHRFWEELDVEDTSSDYDVTTTGTSYR